MNKEKKPSPTPVRLPPEIKAKALAKAKEEGRTLSGLIIHAIRKYVE